MLRRLEVLKKTERTSWMCDGAYGCWMILGKCWRVLGDVRTSSCERIHGMLDDIKGYLMVLGMLKDADPINSRQLSRFASL